MALGKNLKKQQLIPDKENTISASGSKNESKKSKTEKKVQKSKRTKSAGKKSAMPAISKRSDAKSTNHGLKKNKQVQENQPTVEDSRYVSAAEYQRRQELRAKFNRELKTLKDKQIHLIVFRLGSEEYAIEISKTREVVVTPPVSRAPHAPEYIRGVTNIRGSVVMVVDLGFKFDLYSSKTSTENTPQYTMVLNHDRYKVGILIHEVPVSLVVNGSSIAGSEGILTDDSIHKTYIKGVIKEKDRMIFFVDADELLESDKVHVLPEATEGK